MHPDFKPLFKNGHLATIAGNFWKRPDSSHSIPATRTPYQIDPDTAVVSFEQTPKTIVKGHFVVLHGLEGSAEAGYIRSFAHSALEAGYAVHRLNLRTCGGTESLSRTMYHSGLTSDTSHVISQISSKTALPIYLVGYSLGGNVALKLTGEFGIHSPLSGTVAISAPIDLAVCVREIDKFTNYFYARRFLDRLKSRIRRKSILSPETYQTGKLQKIQSIWQFDDQYTALLFGFGSASNYYATQSSINYLNQIQSPTLLLAAKDDPLVPSCIYDHEVIKNNRAIDLLTPDYGGHVGFLSRKQPRFWVDGVILQWVRALAAA